MTWHQQPDFWNILSALIISTVSGFVSIARRILKGQPAKPLWVISEFLMAILCGYLVYQAYPQWQPTLPEWITLPVAVAAAAHFGGKMFQIFEETVLRRFARFLNRVFPDSETSK